MLMHNALSDPLFETPNGIVRRCPCCAELEVRFHDETLSLTQGQLVRLHETACAAAQAGPLWGWRLRARTARQDVSLTLWGDDAAELEALLEGALAMLDLSRLLETSLGAPLRAARNLA